VRREKWFRVCELLFTHGQQRRRHEGRVESGWRTSQQSGVRNHDAASRGRNRGGVEEADSLSCPSVTLFFLTFCEWISRDCRRDKRRSCVGHVFVFIPEERPGFGECAQVPSGS